MYAQSSEDTQDVPNVTVEALEAEQQSELVPFPSLSQTALQLEAGTGAGAAPATPLISSTSPNSNLTSSSSPLTYSDKLSALPQTITTPNLHHHYGSGSGRGGSGSRSPQRFSRHSLDASKSWPNIVSGSATTSPSNIEASFGISPSLNAAVWPNTIGGGGRVRATASESSLERGTRTAGAGVGGAEGAGARGETGRRSLDSDRGSVPTMHSVRQAFQRLHRGSDPISPPPAVGVRASTPDAASRSASQHSRSRSRAASPLRILQQWSAAAGLHRPNNNNNNNNNHDQEEAAAEPFIPVNPFQYNFRFRLPSFSLSSLSGFMTSRKKDDSGLDLPVFHRPLRSSEPTTTVHDGDRDEDFVIVDGRDMDGVRATATNATTADRFGHSKRPHKMSEETKTYIHNALINLVLLTYLYLLLCLPSMYFSRVSRIFEDAEVSKPDVRRMIERCRGGSRFMAHSSNVHGGDDRDRGRGRGRGRDGNSGHNVENRVPARGQTSRLDTSTNNNRRERQRSSNPNPPTFSPMTGTTTAANLAAAGFGIASPFVPNQPGHHTPVSGQQQQGLLLSPAAAASMIDVESSLGPMLPMLPLPEEWTPGSPFVSPALMRFKHSWEEFIDSLLREWKTLNVVSALLLSAILTMFQVPDAATDPLTRTAALLSLICAIMSLSYGCMYIVRFGTMRSMYRASRWAEEAQKTKTFLWWNVWILLAMPVVFMSWSMIFFITAIICYVWRTGSVLDPPEREGLPPKAALGPRIAVTSLFVIGMVYFVLIVKTLKSYGSDNGGTGSGGGTNVVVGSRMGRNDVEMDSRAYGGRGYQDTQRRGQGQAQVDINPSVWERRGRERERSSTSVRKGLRQRSASLTRKRPSEDGVGGGGENQDRYQQQQQPPPAPRLDFRERVNSLGHGHGQGLGLGHGQGGYRKLFGLGLIGGGSSGQGASDSPNVIASRPNSAVDLRIRDDRTDGDMEKGLPVEKMV